MVNHQRSACHENTFQFVTLHRNYYVFVFSCWREVAAADTARTIDKSKTMDKITYNRKWCLCVPYCRISMVSARGVKWHRHRFSPRDSLRFCSTFLPPLFGLTKWTIEMLACVLPASIVCVFDVRVPGAIWCVHAARNERLHASSNEDLWDAIKSNCHNVRRSIDKWTLRSLFLCVWMRVYARFHCVWVCAAAAAATSESYKLPMM